MGEASDKGVDAAGGRGGDGYSLTGWEVSVTIGLGSVFTSTGAGLWIPCSK